DGPRWAERGRQLFPACYPLALAGVAVQPPGQAAAWLRQRLDQYAPTFTPEEMPAAAAAFSRAIQEAVRAAPGDPSVVALLRRGCEVFPESARLAEELAQALRLAGEDDESLAHFARALEL